MVEIYFLQLLDHLKMAWKSVNALKSTQLELVNYIDHYFITIIFWGKITIMLTDFWNILDFEYIRSPKNFSFAQI